jgi:hypothetical protein
VRMAQVLRLRPGFCGLDVVFKEPEGLFLFPVEKHFQEESAGPQISPLRSFGAPLGMTILLGVAGTTPRKDLQVLVC